MEGALLFCMSEVLCISLVYLQKEWLERISCFFRGVVSRLVGRSKAWLLGRQCFLRLWERCIVAIIHENRVVGQSQLSMFQGLRH